MTLLILLLSLLFLASSPSSAQPPDPREATIALLPALPAGIPSEALKYRSRIIREVHYHWGLGQKVSLFFAQIHQESRFRAEARSRHASGLGQFTPPTATDAQSLFPADLKELCRSRGGCPLDPAWAIRALVLWDLKLYRARDFAQGDERFAFMLADYNGGPGWINRERGYCQQSGECRPDVYFREVQRACGKSSPAPRIPDACRENNHYPEVIIRTWRPLYDRWLPGI